MYVIPKPGFLIMDPDLLDRLPPDGREVPDTMYWHRMIQFGDVTSGEPPKLAPITGSGNAS